MVRPPQANPGAGAPRTPKPDNLIKTVETFYTPVIVLSAVFGAIFIFGPCFVRKGENVGIIRVSIMLSAFSMWIFWVTVYISQMNPLMGPRLDNTTLAWIAHTWGNPATGKKVV